MATPATYNDFLELVRKSGLIEDKRLDAYLEKSHGKLPDEPGKLAGFLVRDGLLTHFQAEQILLGKWRRFSIGKYKVLERLGSGGMGSVYLCEHKLMRRRVAVKVLPTAKAADPASLDRFYREARAAAALVHPNIVHAYDVDQDESLHFLVMEYVDGANLQEIVKKSGGPLSIERACHYIYQSAVGLDHAHRAGLVHRDIKPGNILVDRTGCVKVLDMGLARFFNDEEDILTKKYDENVLGTADYLSPEQATDSHNVDIRADIYSLGATFYYLLSGKTPFGEGTIAQKLIWHQTRQPKSVTTLRSEVPPELDAILNKMMAKDPDQRYSTPQEVAQVLESWVQHPIDPPAENEMPRLSLAATGVNYGEGGSMANINLGPAGPRSSSGVRKVWQVTGPNSGKPKAGQSSSPKANASARQDTKANLGPATKPIAPTRGPDLPSLPSVSKDKAAARAASAAEADDEDTSSEKGRNFWIIIGFFATVLIGALVAGSLLIGWLLGSRG